MPPRPCRALAVVIGLFSLAAAGHAFLPLVVYDISGKNDKSYGQAAWQGAERFRLNRHAEYLAVQRRRGETAAALLEREARTHPELIIVLGFNFSQAVEQVAQRHPHIRFTLIDAVAAGPNVQSILFKEHEGSFLAGMTAAMKSRSATVGFVGGMDSPEIRSFACGFVQGVRYVNPNVRVLQDMAGTADTAFDDPAQGGRLAENQLRHGADVIYAAAGKTGIGVLKAAHHAGRFAIGVDSDQNGLFPGTVLTSMIKRVDLAVYNSMVSAQDGRWHAGVQVYGLKEHAVGLAMDAFNRRLLTPSMRQRLQQANKDIVGGKITVVDYRSTHQCLVN